MNDPFLSVDGPILMGIVNVTPDSFSDGGQFLDPAKAIAHGLKLVEEGAHILDIGGESTRPGAAPVSVDEELRRVIPVIEGLRTSGVLLSIDTRHAAVMDAALKAGAGMVNDVSALTFDPDSMHVVAKDGCYVCLMHMKGEPKTMQEAPRYEDVFAEVYVYLENRIAACKANGIQMDRIIADPGIGFGKNLSHNLTLLNRLADFESLGVPVMLAASRKRFIDAISGGAAPDHRLGGSLATAIAGYQRGARVYRVHDVAETAQALAVHHAISRISV
jgi:dihydropteroate synthase